MPSQHDESVEPNRPLASLPASVDRAALADWVDRETLETVVELGLGASILVALLGLVSVLPGVDRLVPETPITVLSVAVAVVTVAVAGTLVALARPVEDLVYQATGGPERLRLLTAVVAKHLVVVSAVVVTYHGFAGVAVPFLAVTDSVWLYDLGFLALAAVPTAFAAYYCYRALEPSAAHVADRLLATPVDTASDDVGRTPAADGDTEGT